MLSIQPPKLSSSSSASQPQKTTPHLLPMRINHNGRINDTQQYWKPETDEKGTQHVHFRGRHLHGTPLPLPENYTGAVLNVTDKHVQVPTSQARSNSQSQSQSQSQRHDDEEEEGDAEEEEAEAVQIAEQIGSFDEIIVWGHGGQVDGAQDMFVRGVREWVGFAESMHVEGEEDA